MKNFEVGDIIKPKIQYLKEKKWMLRVEKVDSRNNFIHLKIIYSIYKSDNEREIDEVLDRMNEFFYISEKGYESQNFEEWYEE